MTGWRPASAALALFALLLAAQVAVLGVVADQRARQGERARELRPLAAQLGLSDLALSTEARYTRHPAVSDALVVVMDHPGAIDHFPSTLFFATPR